MTDPETTRQLQAAIKALGHSEAENRELRRRIATLEHVAAGNKRHVQLIVPDLERAEAAITRVRAVVHVADDEDVTDWQRGFRACSVVTLAALDKPAPGPAATQATERNCLFGRNGRPCQASEPCATCDPTTTAANNAARTITNNPVVLRDPCPRCEDCRFVPRQLMADHMREHHPEEQHG